jgi:hypothetical protein
VSEEGHLAVSWYFSMKRYEYVLSCPASSVSESLTISTARCGLPVGNGTDTKQDDNYLFELQRSITMAISSVWHRAIETN